MLTTDLLSPLLAAWTSASTASSGVLKRCCACASEDSARISIAAPASMVILLKRRTYCDLIMAVHPSMRLRWGGGNPRARGEPLVVGLERQPELVVVDAQISVVAADDCIRSNDLHFLRHHADISLVAAVVAEAIEAEPAVQMPEQDDVVLERDVRAASAAATTTAATSAAAAATAAACAGAATTTATATHTRVTTSGAGHRGTAAAAAAGECTAATATTTGPRATAGTLCRFLTSTGTART